MSETLTIEVPTGGDSLTFRNQLAIQFNSASGIQVDKVEESNQVKISNIPDGCLEEVVSKARELVMIWEKN